MRGEEWVPAASASAGVPPPHYTPKKIENISGGLNGFGYLLPPKPGSCPPLFSQGSEMNHTYRLFSLQQTPQSEPIPGKNMVENNAKGFVFRVDKWDRMRRFLVLGAEGGTFYVKEQPLVRENALCVLQCLDQSPARAVDLIVEVSQKAARNDPCLFALALACAHRQAKRYALGRLAEVARIGTHLFSFMAYVRAQRGMGRALRRALRNWYQLKEVDQLAYQAVKYQRRGGWSHRDVLRLVRPKTADEVRNNVYRWIVHGATKGEVPSIIDVHFKAWTSTKPNPDLVREGLTREMIPTQWLRDKEVWKALLHGMLKKDDDGVCKGLTVLLRNLGKLTAVGVLHGPSVNEVCDAFKKTGRLHPLSILNAMRVYAQGVGEKGSLSWDPVPQIADALNDAFYAAFDNIGERTKRTLLALDLSSSMSWARISGMAITPREASAALAMATMRCSDHYFIMGFSSEFIHLDLSTRMRLDSILQAIEFLPFGGTDCAVPMIWALENSISVDTFIVYTDNETWLGSIHPTQALEMYRRKMGIPAKLIVVGMTATDLSIADPNDPGMLDIVGFDVNTPSLITDFSEDKL